MAVFCLFWVIAGLLVIYRIGINEIMFSMGIESMLNDDEDEDCFNPICFSLTMFLLLIIWPLIWLDMQNTGYR